ncbi:adenylate cyclase type 10-like [Ceratina calcarata]|uniref:Adenylate cyclase type 10-like n=1 Tax=Ceratina calcarata TaxID=156304 RepID=A0AAJ7S4E1_9HYME|nr:adenylate cyclase type 10-like [Ceratina calcarata]
MATFVPDELIYEKDLSKKSFRRFNAVVSLIHMQNLFNIYEKYVSGENGGSHALFTFLDSVTNIVIQEVYSSNGDVLKFSQDSMLVMWKDVKYTRRLCLPGDLVLSSSAWEHCAPSQYDYVIKDSSNIKIIKVLGPPAEVAKKNDSTITPVSYDDEQNTQQSPSESVLSDDSIDETDSIEFRKSEFKYLTEIKQITVVCISVIPIQYSVYELISLLDEAYKLIQNIIEPYYGCIAMLNLFEKDISFYLLYGLKEYEVEGVKVNYAKNAILSTFEITEALKEVAGIKSVLAGISTGTAFCGVVGHIVRRQYMILGAPVNKAISLMIMSFDKIFCDYDTLLKSELDKDKFRSRGIKVLKKFGKCQVYEFGNTGPPVETMQSLEYNYPLLDRHHEVEYFKDILDDIGVIDRAYSGMLIEGPERSGKSRVLDAFATIVRNRQIKLIKLSLHASHTEKAFAVLYHIFLQLFNAENCTSIDDRERVLISMLSEILHDKEFCYLNTIMRVQFPLSKDYCEDTEWKRHGKSLEIFEQILNQVLGRICIILDDVQHMDLLSWQFLSSALNNCKVVLIMAMAEPISWDNLSQVEAGMCQDKRLLNRTLEGLDPMYLSAFACQFLNVMAIPKGLEK